MTGCNTPTQNSFQTGPANYSNIEKNAPVIEARLFTKLSSNCTSIGTSQEALPALVVTGLGFLVKEGVAHGKQYLEKQAAYLSADIKLNAKAFLSFEKTPLWPPQGLASDYLTGKAEKAKQAGEASDKAYKIDKPGTKSDDIDIISSRDKAISNAGKEYDDAPNEIKATRNDLCLLVVAGEYKASSTESAKLKKDFVAFTGARANLLDEYSMPLPALDVSDYPRPFDTLNKDPSFLIEMHLTPTPVGGKMLYTLKPTYIFYPYPLHKKSANGLERKVTIEVTLGENKLLLTFDNLKSGSTYDSSDLATKYTLLEAPINQHFQTVDVNIIEGPDSMPTAKILNDIAAQDKTIEKYLIEKIDAIAAKDSEESQAAK